MNVLPYVSLCVLLNSAFFASAALANGTFSKTPSKNQRVVSTLAATNFSPDMRWTIKREIMSKPGVMLDMANMTDNGYTWTKDAVWAGSSAAENDQWYIAGFMFERPHYKGVWLQYAFTFSSLNGEIANFRRWYGNATFR